MQNPNNYIYQNEDDTDDIISDAINARQWVYASFQANFSESSAAGTIQLQFSNDPPLGVPVKNFTPTNWTNVPGTQALATVAAGASVCVYSLPGFVAQWYRIVFTQSGGAGTSNCTYNALFA